MTKEDNIYTIRTKQEQTSGQKMFTSEENLEEETDNQEEETDEVSKEYFKTIDSGGESLLDNFYDAEQITPDTAKHRRLTPTVTLLPTGQLVFSRAFDVFLGKNKKNE